MTDKESSVENAVSDARRNYGEDIDITALTEQLEANGWVFNGD